jgi:hypothetical protein
MWAPLIEKVGAKIKGAYVNADGGLTANSMRMLTGAPTSSISTNTFTDDASL